MKQVRCSSRQLCVGMPEQGWGGSTAPTAPPIRHAYLSCTRSTKTPRSLLNHAHHVHAGVCAVPRRGCRAAGCDPGRGTCACGTACAGHGRARGGSKRGARCAQAIDRTLQTARCCWKHGTTAAHSARHTAARLFHMIIHSLDCICHSHLVRLASHHSSPIQCVLSPTYDDLLSTPSCPAQRP